MPLLNALRQLMGSGGVLWRRRERASPSSERRNAMRYPAVENHGWLGWWDDQTYTETPAQVYDVSHDGIQVIVDRLPPPGAPVWYRLETTGPTTSSPALVVHNHTSEAGQHVLGLRFPESCSYQLFSTLRGLVKVQHIEQPVTVFDRHGWR